jgi:hypothetical protein
MSSYTTLIIQKYARSGILLDTNILLLLCIGLYDHELITTFKRTQLFVKEDYRDIRQKSDSPHKLVSVHRLLKRYSESDSPASG